MKLVRSRLLRGAAVAGVFAAVVVGATPASAYVACNPHGDCWHTDSRIHFPGVRLAFHPDNWWDRHVHDRHFRWHDADTGHDWHHGYWVGGRWHGI